MSTTKTVDGITYDDVNATDLHPVIMEACIKYEDIESSITSLTGCGYTEVDYHRNGDADEVNELREELEVALEELDRACVRYGQWCNGCSYDEEDFLHGKFVGIPIGNDGNTPISTYISLIGIAIILGSFLYLLLFT